MLKNYFLRVKNIINSKSRVIVLIIVVLSSIILLFNNLSNNISKIHVDEQHTIEMAFKSISGENYESLRAGESSRLLAKIIYPFAIYHMNKCMGGEHYITTWKYSCGPSGSTSCNSQDSTIKIGNINGSNGQFNYPCTF